MSLSGKELETLVIRLLTENVPPGVVARVFDLDTDLVKATQKTLRVRRYGTDDLSDFLEQMQWEAISDALETLHEGSTAEKARIHSLVLGKQMALSARRSPEAARDSAAKVMDLMTQMREGEAAAAEPSRFVVTAED